MALEDRVPACEDIGNAGFWSVECWGGATFDACIRFLNEDPWERLRTSRKCCCAGKTCWGIGTTPVAKQIEKNGGRGAGREARRVFFVHPKLTEAAALGYLVEVVQEA
jgi:hypothetical protein